ncbi:PIN domain-containing protein [Nakamurella aerolata]|uniref:PIN domain-containing protein n=1 Tax=Nakamurella aerolata TaxID=1656892 RepID=A0A849ACV9_9ACTN|nr:PIN domain-containing protein [Nakamurella aerolata]
MLVVDASVLVPALVDRDGDGERARALLRSDRLWLPNLAYLEVISVLRRLTRAGD